MAEVMMSSQSAELTPEEIAELKAAEKMPIVFDDDCPEMTEDMLKQFRRMSAKPIKLYFIRHGETDWNIQKRLQGREDIPMNAAGRQQAAECAKYLSLYWREKGYPQPLIVTSPLSRAWDTAAAIAEELAIPAGKILRDGALVERDYGTQSGMTYQERDQYEKTHPDSSEIETREHTAQRVWESVRLHMEQCRQQGCEHLILVTHGGCIRSALRSLADEQIDWDKLLLNAGVTILEESQGRFRLLVHNQSAETLYLSLKNPPQS